MPDERVLLLALLYSLGAHGIMTLNDFKAIQGDRQMGVRSLPVVVGPEVAAKIACIGMALPQMIVISLLFIWDRPLHALAVERCRARIGRAKIHADNHVHPLG